MTQSTCTPEVLLKGELLKSVRLHKDHSALNMKLLRHSCLSSSNERCVHLGHTFPTNMATITRSSLVLLF